MRDVVEINVTEGLAVYLNGTDLPDEVYATSDVNELIAGMHGSLGDEGRMQSYWQGPRETALYLYGSSAARMSDLIVGLYEDWLSLDERIETVSREIEEISQNEATVAG